jgi:hypothetical protein
VRLFLQLLVSADGFFDEPNRELDWFVVVDEDFEYVDTVLDSQGEAALNTPPARTVWNRARLALAVPFQVARYRMES